MSERQPLVCVDAADGIATIVLDDPDHRNALSWAIVCAITQAVGDVVAAELEPQRWSMQRPAFEEALAELRERLGKASS